MRQQRAMFSSILFRRLFFGAATIFFVLVAVYCVFYLKSAYQYLAYWFISKNNCFYRNYDWTNRFFTPQVKEQGNYFAIAGLVIAGCGFIYMWLRRKEYFSFTPGEASHSSAKTQPLWYAAIVLMACGIWYWGQSIIKPGADEIFSSVNCAEQPSFQILTYYMLPNNHVYFNLINHYLIRLTHADGVLTGRVISLFMYVGVLCCIYYYLTSLIKNHFWAFIALLPAALQFTPWAMGFQARGYECQLLCAWAAFLTMFRYMDTGKTYLLRMNAVFCIIGFAMIPTFLYYFVAQVIFILLWQLSSRKVSLIPWKYFAFCVAGVFLLYLPALCFSGKAALTSNEYVKTAEISVSAFMPRLLEGGKYFVNFVFSFLIKENHPLNFILFLFPLSLFFFRDKQRKRLGVFYVLLWLVWILMCIQMRRLPFARNMIMHYSFSIVIIIYSVYSLLEILVQRIKATAWKNTIRVACFMVPVVVLCIHLAKSDKEMGFYYLYFLDVNGMYTHYNEDLKNIPPGSTVAFSDERYCFYYYCRKGPYKPTKCASGNEEYFVKADIEPLPDIIAKNYVLYKVCFSGDIYKHK